MEHEPASSADLDHAKKFLEAMADVLIEYVPLFQKIGRDKVIESLVKGGAENLILNLTGTGMELHKPEAYVAPKYEFSKDTLWEKLRHARASHPKRWVRRLLGGY